MNRISKKWLLILSFPVVLGIGAWAYGPRALGAFGDMHGMLKPERVRQIIDWRVNDFLDEINATSEQRTEIHNLKDKIMEDFIQSHSEMESAHQLLLDEWKSDSPDLSAINAAIDQGAVMKTKMAKKIAKDLTELHRILAPEQRQILTSMIEDHVEMAHNLLKSR